MWRRTARLRALSPVRAAFVLAEGEVEHLMHLIFDAPVATHGVVERPR